MSILDKMRSGTDSTFMQMMLGAVFIAFVVSYAKPSGDTRGTIVATVNGVAIKDTDFMRAFAEQERRYDSLTDEQKKLIEKAVKEDLIKREVLRQEAARQGVTVSPREILQEISIDSRFADDQGLFDAALYESRVKRMGYSRADYEQMIRDQLLRLKVQRTTARATHVSNGDLSEAWRRRETELDVAWVRVPPLKFGDDVDLSTEAVAKFISENPDRVKSSYDADFDRLYNIPEKLRVSVIVLKLREDGVTIDDLGARIADLKAKIEAGGDFADLARRYSEDPTAASGGAKPERSIGEFDSSSAELLATAAVGALVEVARSDSVQLVRVEERIAGRVVPQTEAQDEIARRILREEEVPRLAAAYAEKLLAAWIEQGVAPSELLAAQDLELEQTGSFSGMRGPEATSSPPIDLLRELLDAPIGPPSRVFEEEGTYYLAGVSARVEPDPTGFDAAKIGLQADLRAERQAEFLSGWMDDLVKRAKVDNGT